MALPLTKVRGSMTRETVRTVDNLTALKTTTGDASNAVVQTVNRDTNGDQGGEQWRWDAASTATADDLVTVRPTAIAAPDPGRWKVNLVKSYQKLIPAGNAAGDTAILKAAMAAGGIYEQKPNSVWDINEPCPPVSYTRLIGNGATTRPVLGTGGFDSTNRSNKFNTGGARTCLFPLGNGNTVGLEGVEFHDMIFAATSSTERVLQILNGILGFAETQLRVTNMIVKDMPCHGGGGFFAASSLGDGSAFFDNIRGYDCTISGTSWTGTPQITLVEIDTDLQGVVSKPGTIRAINARNFRLTGAALTAYEQQADVVTLGGTTLALKAGAWDVNGIFGKETGEIVDSFAHGAMFNNIRGENCLFVFKLIHGARYCVASNISGKDITGVGCALIVLGGTSVVGSGDTLGNVISNATVEGSWGTADSCAVLIQKNTGTTGVPKKNTIHGLRILGDANMTHYVKDNCDVDADNDNRIYLIDGSAAATKSVSIAYADNTRVHALNRGVAQISLGADQTVTTLATADFSVATVDPEGIAVTPSDKVTIKWAGLYLVEIGGRFSGDLDDADTVEIRCVGGGITQVTRTTIGKSGEEDVIRESFHVLIKEQDIGSGSADIYAQVAVEGATSATLVSTVNYTGMWISRIG